MLNFKQYSCSPIFKIFFLFCCLSFSPLQGQTDSLAGKSFDELAQKYFKTIRSKPKTALIYMTAAYKNAVKNKNQRNQLRSLYGKTFSLFLDDQNDAALSEIDIAIPLGEQLKENRLLYKLYNIQGNAFFDKGDYLKALDSYLKAKEYAALENDKAQLLEASINIGFMKKNNQDLEEAISIFTQSLQDIEETPLEAENKNFKKISIYLHLADTYLRLGEFNDDKKDTYIQKAEDYTELGLQICDQSKTPKTCSSLGFNKAIILYEKGKHTESNQLAEKIKEYAQNENDVILLSNVYFYKGKNYYALKDYENAIQFLEEFQEITRNSDKKYLNELQMHDILAWCYYETGNIKKSKFHLQESKRLFDLEKKQNVKVISEIHNKNDLPEVLTSYKKLEDAFAQQELKKKWLYGIAIFLVLLLAGSIYFYRLKVKRIQKRAAQVLEKVIALENEQEKQKEARNQEVKTSSISEKVTDTKAALLLEKLTQFEEREEYLSLECSLGYVAEKLESNTSYVSNVINNYKNKSFKVYITELRINAALIRLKNDEKLRSYTIKAIAEEFGFKRQETFSKAFKAQTGIYPSQYLKKLRDDLEID